MRKDDVVAGVVYTGRDPLTLGMRSNFVVLDDSTIYTLRWRKNPVIRVARAGEAIGTRSGLYSSSTGYAAIKVPEEITSTLREYVQHDRDYLPQHNLAVVDLVRWGRAWLEVRREALLRDGAELSESITVVVPRFLDGEFVTELRVAEERARIEQERRQHVEQVTAAAKDRYGDAYERAQRLGVTLGVEGASRNLSAPVIDIAELERLLDLAEQGATARRSAS